MTKICECRTCDNEVKRLKSHAKFCSKRCMMREVSFRILDKPLPFITCNKCGIVTDQYFPRFSHCKQCHNDSHPVDITCHSDLCNKVFKGARNVKYCSYKCSRHKVLRDKRELRMKKMLEHVRTCAWKECTEDITLRRWDAKYCCNLCRLKDKYHKESEKGIQKINI